MRFWGASTHRERAKPPPMGVLALPVAFTADGLTLATGGQEDNARRLWRIE
jgi:WD40 repeat protein